MVMDIFQKFAPRTRRGRKRRAQNQIMNLLAISHYEKRLAWLQSRKRRMGLQGSSTIQDPPHELAARMVAKWLGRNQSYRSVLNLVSRYR